MERVSNANLSDGPKVHKPGGATLHRGPRQAQARTGADRSFRTVGGVMFGSPAVPAYRAESNRQAGLVNTGGPLRHQRGSPISSHRSASLELGRLRVMRLPPEPPVPWRTRTTKARFVAALSH